MLARGYLTWRRLYLTTIWQGSGVESGFSERGSGKYSQRERVQKRESSSIIYWGILLDSCIVPFTGYFQLQNKPLLSNRTQDTFIYEHMIEDDGYMTGNYTRWMKLSITH